MRGERWGRERGLQASRTLGRSFRGGGHWLEISREQVLSCSHPGGRGRCSSLDPGCRTQVGVGTGGRADRRKAVRARSPLDPLASQAGGWSRPRQCILGRPYRQRQALAGFALNPGRWPGSYPPHHPRLSPLVKKPLPRHNELPVSFSELGLGYKIGAKKSAKF